MRNLFGVLALVAASIQLTGCISAGMALAESQKPKSASVSDVNMAVAQLPKPMTMGEFFPVAKNLALELKYQLTGSGGRTIAAMKNSGEAGTLGVGRTYGFEQVRLTLNPDGTKVQIDVTTKGAAAEKADDVLAKFKEGLERPASVSKM